MSNYERDILLNSNAIFEEIGTVIICFSTGGGTFDHMTPLLREPAPKTGWKLESNFEQKFREAINLNSAIHDGALAFSRPSISEPYRLKAWSCRLFPPFNNCKKTPNKGVAWNSCLAASMINSIDKIFLFSSGQYIEFADGKHNSISSRKD